MDRMVLSNLAENEDYVRKVLPHLRENYFSTDAEKVVFRLVSEYFDKYNVLPSKEAMVIDLKNLNGVSEGVFKNAKTLIESLNRNAATDFGWLVKTTEKFCKDRALYNALVEAATIVDDKSGKSIPDSIPELMAEALSVGFDTKIGHDYMEDSQTRFDFYHRNEERLPFDIVEFNDMTKGGLVKKTLTIIMAGTGVGKTLMMCHMAAANYLAGKNVLYVTLEMAEERIAERIDANVLNVSLNDLKDLSREDYEKKISFVKSKTVGRLIVKEYPTASAHAGHIRSLLKELRVKKNFVPDVIYVDYLAICSSSRIKATAGANSYTLVKSIAEELRGLAVEFDVPLITAAQVNRTGIGSSDVDLTDTSESIGLPFTADLMFAVINTEELEKESLLLVKQLKNRFDDLSRMRKFVIGVDRSRMKLRSVNQEENKDFYVPKSTGAPPTPADMTQKFRRLI